MIRFSIQAREDRAQALIDLLDSKLQPATFKQYSGGQPDPFGDISSMAPHAVSTSYVAGDYVTSGLNYYRAENDGTSDASAPTFPTDGGTVADNDITWSDMGEIPVLQGTLTLSKPCGTVTTTKVGSQYQVFIDFDPWTEDSSADAGGTASWGRLSDGDGNVVLDGDIGLEGSGAMFQINTTNIIPGSPIKIKTGTAPKLIEGGA